MKDFNIGMFDDMEMDVAFTLLIFLYAEFATNGERLYHLTMEYGYEDMAKAYNENSENLRLVREKIMEYWRNK